MFYLLDLQTGQRVVKAEQREHLEYLLSALEYPHWRIIEA